MARASWPGYPETNQTRKRVGQAHASGTTVKAERPCCRAPTDNRRRFTYHNQHWGQSAVFPQHALLSHSAAQ
jgi:hypothetical protein